MKPVLWIVIPCYNEEKVLPVTAPMFDEKIDGLIRSDKISEDSKILFVNDGSKDRTWDIITDFSKENSHYIGISQSRNRGHQNAVLAGMMEAKDVVDIIISIDCDGQDDINAMDEMIEQYLGGCEVVYGVRSNRDSDTWFKRTTAQGFYKFMNFMGAEVVYNHADYRLVSSRVIKELANYKEVNLFLRGMIPLVGFKSTAVYYERHERMAGESHYPIKKMLSFAFDGITSLSTKPITMITELGIVVSFIGFVLLIWAIIRGIQGDTEHGWASLTCIVCFLGGIQIFSLGVIGKYVGKTYMETKHRPRYIISERTWEEDDLFREKG